MATKRIDKEIRHFTDLEHIWWGAKTPAGQRRYDRRFELLKKVCRPGTKSRILEIGCGDGEFTSRLVKLRSKIIATDITPAVIKKAKLAFKNYPVSRIKFKIENSEKLSFKDGAFDLVCGISILHHVDYVKTLKESFRVLKKGGYLFFSEPNLINPNIFLGLNIPWLRKRMEYSPDEVALIRWRIEKILRQIGFSKVMVVNHDFLHPSTPTRLVSPVEKLSDFLEEVPGVKEISGSLIIWARK
jgi:2-polyprenyl-3-methyl-5-hydroxy-6-metoxy-1,4-benzoquinol methylase